MISTCTRKQAKDGTPTITVKELQELYVGYRFIYSPADLIEYIDGLVKISFSGGAPISELNDSTKDCVVCWLESYRRDVYVGYIDERTEIR